MIIDFDEIMDMLGIEKPKKVNYEDSYQYLVDLQEENELREQLGLEKVKCNKSKEQIRAIIVDELQQSIQKAAELDNALLEMTSKQPPIQKDQKVIQLKRRKKVTTISQDYIGLDRAVVSNITIEAIDFEKLRSTNAKIYTTDSKGIVGFIPDSQTGELIQFSSIKIEDNIAFKSFNIGTTLTQSGPIIYTHLETYVDRKDQQFNYIPYTLEEFKQNLISIQDYLLINYGITANVQTSTFLELEINQNIHTPKAFKEYQHILNFMAQNASKRYKKTLMYTGRNTYTGFDLKNKSFELKCYDKKSQLKNVRHIDVPETMRFEITISNKSKQSKAHFEKYMGTNKIFEVTQSKINAAFNKLMTNILLINMNKSLTVLDKKVDKMAKSFTSAKEFINKMYKIETQEKQITLVSASQLANTSFYDEVLNILPQNQINADTDLNFILGNLLAA